MHKRRAGIVFFTILIVFLQGCVVTSGRKIPLAKLGDFQNGKTTPQEIEAVFGPPEVVIENTVDHSFLYSYQWIVSTVVGIGIPPWFIIGRKADSGYQVNIAFLHGLYAGYAITTHHQNLFKRAAARPKDDSK